MKSMVSTIAHGIFALISPVSAQSKTGAKDIVETDLTADTEPAAWPEGAPEPGPAIRLVGDATVKPKLADVGIEAPLPEMIELKTYPAVRRAEFSGTGASHMGMIKSFFPLFHHIKKQEIEMTSPVEMEYRRGGDNKLLTEVPLAEVTGR
jgi:hypothetical protein